MACSMMNIRDRSLPASEEAVLDYLDGDYRVIRQGRYVLCGVTGEKIPLENLRYWSVDLQEAYASTDAVLHRLRETQKS
jgi:hypothetical protein